MIQLKLERQKPSNCGPASLKMLLGHYGVKKSQDELAKRCHTTWEKGTTHANLKVGLESLGFQVKAKDQADILELRQLIAHDTPVVVGWFVDEEEHYSVVYKFSHTYIWMMDPELGRGVRRMTIKKFLSVWYGPDGPRQRVVKHWMMWIHSSKE